MVIIVWLLSVMLWWWCICVIRTTPGFQGAYIETPKHQTDIKVPREARDPEYWAL